MLTMNDMLSNALREYHGLREQLDRALLGKNAEKWGKAIRTFMREEPTWTEGMIYIPLEWSLDLGPVSKKFLQDQVDFYCKMNGDGWRLPTHDELLRSMRIMRPVGFVIRIYYWTSTPSEDRDQKGLEVIYTHDGRGGLGSLSDNYMSHNYQAHPHLRLCREVEIAGQAMMKCNGNPEHHGCEKRNCPHRKPHPVHISRYGLQEERWCWYESADLITFEDGKKNPSGGMMVWCDVI
jgi:hypothetical protein